MNVSIVTPPLYEPVSLEDCYSLLRLDPTLVGSPGTLEHPDDAMLTRMITSARIQAEQITRRSFVQQTLRITSPLPRTLQAPGITAVTTEDAFYLFNPPLIEVLSVSYYDSSNALVVAGAGDYHITDDQVPQLRFTTAPTTFAGRNDAFSVDYVVGYPPNGSPPSTREDYIANVPANIKDAILLGVQLLYDELLPAQRVAIENARMSLLSSDIVWTV